MKLKKDVVDTAIANGKIYGYSVVKSVYNTTYYHYVKLASLVENDYNWIPAYHVQFSSGAHGRLGQPTKPNPKTDIPLAKLRGIY